MCSCDYSSVVLMCICEELAIELLPHTHAKVIDRVVIVVSTEIAISQDVGISTCEHNESIEMEFGEKLASVCIKLRDTFHKRHK